MLLFENLCWLKVVLEGCCRCPDSHDLSAYHHLYDLGRHISSPSYKLNSLNFDSEKLFVETLWDHLNGQYQKHQMAPQWYFKYSIDTPIHHIPQVEVSNGVFICLW